MPTSVDLNVTAFSGDRQIASGPLSVILTDIMAAQDRSERLLVFDDTTARPVDLDLRGDVRQALARLVQPAPKGPGRPKLGVTAREVTLLPRHWDWLAAQPGGASVALRKLVEQASKSPAEDRRVAKEVAYRFMMAMAGNRPGLEEANRALFAGDKARFDAETQGWPPDIRDYARRQAATAFG